MGSKTLVAAIDDRHILAERFKTKVCRHFLTHGNCPYENRCMFAHGDADIRTTAMNMRDGLYTEEAIKAFKRAKRIVTRAAGPSPHESPTSYFEVPVTVGSPVAIPPPPHYDAIFAPTVDYYVHPSVQQDHPIDQLDDFRPTTPEATCSDTTSSVGDVSFSASSYLAPTHYTHNPYDVAYGATFFSRASAPSPARKTVAMVDHAASPHRRLAVPA